MAIKRQMQLLGQMRVDVPHLRALESSIANDFDQLAGAVMAGGQALVITGFDIVSPAAAIAGPATSLQLNVANGILFHPQASEAGTVFSVAAGTAAAGLDPKLNAKVVGSFSSSSVNYIGLDLIRTADASTSDLVEFLDANTLLETPRTVPLGRVLDYRIIISTVDFSTTPTVLPIAEVTTDTSDMVLSIKDCRQMMYRLGSGGSVPDKAYSYAWPQSRSEAVNDSALAVFQGGDKAIGNQKDFFDAVMTRLWELGGGEYWYSPTSDRDIKLACGATISGSNDSFLWTGSVLKWGNLSVIFSNSTGTYNTITDNASVGVALADGYCLYVDLDRSTNATVAMAAPVPMTNLGLPAIPGSRFVVAWRHGSQVFTQAGPWEVGRTAAIASNTAGANGLGQVRLSLAGTTYPTVIPLDASGQCINTATGSASSAFIGIGGTGNSNGIEGEGRGTGSGIYGIGSSAPGSSGIGVSGYGGNRLAGNGNGGNGLFGTGGNGYGSGVGGAGVEGLGGTAGSGVKGAGGTNGLGGEFHGDGTGHGVDVFGGASGIGVYSQGGTSASGVHGYGGSGAQGVYGTGGSGSHGVEGLGTGATGNGVVGTGGAPSSAIGCGTGVHGTGGSVSGGGIGGYGVQGDGTGTSTGVLGVGGPANGPGVTGSGTGTGIGVYGLGGSTLAGGPGGSFVGQGTAGDGIKVQAASAGAAIRIIGAGEIILDSARTRYKTMYPREFIQEVGDTGVLSSASGWHQDLSTGYGFVLHGVLRLPAGSTLISFKVLSNNTEATLPQDIILSLIQKQVVLSGTATAALVAGPSWISVVTTCVAGTYKWHDCDAVSPLAVAPANGSPVILADDEVIIIDISMPVCTVGKICNLLSVRFEYTQPINPGHEI